MFRWIVGALVLTGVVLSGGCAEETFSKSVWNPFDIQPVFLSGAEPVRIGIVRGDVQKDSILNPMTWLRLKRTPWMSLQRELSRELQRPVVIEDLKPFQIAAHLQSGRVQFAWLPAVDYLELNKEGRIGNVLALSEGGQRRGLIVTSAKSDVQSLDDIRARRFAFGPKDDPVLHAGALEVLSSAGISADDIAKELLPVPGSLQFHINSSEAAKEVIYGLDIEAMRTAAGVIEEADYMSYPETGGRLLPLPTFSKDQFRILARTEPVQINTLADGPVVAAADADKELVTTVRDFLLSADREHKVVLKDLGVAQFHHAPDGARAQVLKLRELAADQTPATQPETMNDEQGTMNNE